ncbi:hypothetical protein LR48_Vigan01g053400 [Vigna angularis]|uniref:Uncharacterized protein n=1 Tax=Phaseolus angularis TaxID=3914 RepID=A0A0L9TLH1_PHAAN|nr:hypothetical protein LR48_Vigan01g053400 [Vigna angularis]
METLHILKCVDRKRTGNRLRHVSNRLPGCFCRKNHSGFIQNADNRWVHRNSPPLPEPQRNPPPQLFIPPPPPPRSRFDEVMTGINDLRTFVGDSFNTLNETMNARFEQ